MQHELFVEQPNMELKEGIKVTKETEVIYKHGNVEQTLKNLVLETMLKDAGTNGINTFESASYIKINLNEGDILLFDKDRGYYMPPYPMTTAEDAISDLESIQHIRLEQRKVSEDDTERDEKESSSAN